MKVNDSHSAKKKSFIKLPQYPGGKNAFKEFVSQNLKYPEDALKNRIEGVVHAEYEVNDHGKVIDIRIKKGIGYGCDEETIRILSLMVYEPAHNRGMRVKSKVKARIPFKLPAPAIDNSVTNVNINYAISEKKVIAKEPTKSYSYTINMG
jgi:TonB family protein